MATVKVTQVRSIIGRTARQKATMKALGLRKIGHSVEKELSDSIEGMISKVQHLVKVEEL